MEVVIPIEIGLPTAKTVMQGQRDDSEKLIRQLDWANEIRENAAIQMTSFLSLESNRSLQQKNVSMSFPNRNPSPQESLWEHSRSRSQKASG